jgi:glycosyltransferase involved in cell wall biosynthesis
MPAISIVIPAFNVENYIVQSVRSALAQTLDDLEVIVVDDGSTDETAAKVLSIDDSRLRLIQQSNRGLSGARNSGIKAAHGEFIGFLDGDDTWLPQKAHEQIEIMRRDPKIGLTYSYSLYIDQNDRPTGAILFTRARRPSLAQMIRRNAVGNGSTPIVRKDCFEQAGLFDEELRSCEDWEMWVRILRTTYYSAELVPLPLTRYRVNLQSLSMNYDNFLNYARKAAQKIERETPEIAPRIVREGLAMAYRIAATKALYNGHRQKSLSLMKEAVGICPWLPFVDSRFAVTMVMMLTPLSIGSRIRNIVSRSRLMLSPR